MKTITQYKEDIRVLMDKVAAIDSKCVSENREPNEEELEFQNEVMNTVTEYRAVIATMERRERIAGELEQPTTPQTQAKDEKRSPITARDKDKFNSLGEQLAAVMRAGIPGGSVDPRLHNIHNAATGLGETVPSDGGFLLQPDFSTTMLQDVFETGILASRCDRVPISGKANSITINGIDETSRATTRYGGIVSYWLDEAGTKVASKPKFRQIELKLKKMIGLCYSTDELLDDAAALQGIISDGFRSEFGFRIDDAIINGTGAGMPLGLLNGGSLVSVGAETGQPAATIVAENVIKMYSRLFASSRPNAVWLINQNVEPQLFTMSLSVGTGGIPIYLPAGGISAQPHGTLFGLPVLPIEQCPTLGTVGDIVLADLKNGYILAEKGGIKTDVSIHVEFLTDQSVFRFVIRIDGQPVRATELTPYKGGASYTQSHFIALATRS